MSPAAPAFSLLCRPHPPDPLPSGKGEILVFLMQGASPLASPGLDGARHWLDPALAVPCGGAEPQRHLFALPRGRGPSQTPKFLSPGPPSPWLPALPIEKLFYRFCGKLAIPKAHPSGRVVRLPCSSAARVQARGCKGRSPLHEITLVTPFPGGEGGWGDGGRKSS